MKKIHCLISVLVFLIGSLFSCKKEKGVLDDFPPGRFNFVYVLNTSSNQDTITGEVSGPYVKETAYLFIVRQELSIDKSLKLFKVGKYKKINGGYFIAQENTDATITYEDHNSDYLSVQFAAGDTLSGSLTLIRKE